MYSVKLGFDEAIKRIDALLEHKHYAEALVTSVFTMEKLIRRSLRVAIFARGFTSKQAEHLLDRKGFQELKGLFDVFDRDHRTLSAVIGNAEWQYVPKAVEMRNKLVHGQRVYDRDECRMYASQTVKALSTLHKAICADYGIDPWTTLAGRRVSRLGWNPVIRRAAAAKAKLPHKS